MKWILLVLYVNGTITYDAYESRVHCELNRWVVEEYETDTVVRAQCFRGEIVE